MFRHTRHRGACEYEFDVIYWFRPNNISNNHDNSDSCKSNSDVVVVAAAFGNNN